MKNLVLYHFESCPYCQKVVRYIESKNIELSMKDTKKDPDAKEELQKIGGKTQVPCLVIDGLPMYESNDIIDWLSKNG